MWCSTLGCIVTLTLSLLVAPLLAVSQPAGKVRHIGILRAGMNSPEAERNLEAFRHGLRDLGWVEGQNLTIENRAAEGQVERLPALITDLLHLQVEILVTTGGISATQAAKAATSTLPIVMVTSADPVRDGLVASLARPGGNVTGQSLMGTDLAAKRLELLTELVPGLRRLAVLGNPARPRFASQIHEIHTALASKGLPVDVLEVHTPPEFDR